MSGIGQKRDRIEIYGGGEYVLCTGNQRSAEGRVQEIFLCEVPRKHLTGRRGDTICGCGQNRLLRRPILGAVRNSSLRFGFARLKIRRRWYAVGSGRDGSRRDCCCPAVLGRGCYFLGEKTLSNSVFHLVG